MNLQNHQQLATKMSSIALPQINSSALKTLLYFIRSLQTIPSWFYRTKSKDSDADTLTTKALNSISEIDFVYRKKVNCKITDRPQVNNSRKIYEVAMHYWDQDKIDLVEEFKVLYLNRSNRVLEILPISKGGITGTVVDPRLILAAAIKVAAISMILVHNHPSGNLIPSRKDQEQTLKIKEAAKNFDISVYDHVIITSEGYFSFADNGIL